MALPSLISQMDIYIPLDVISPEKVAVFFHSGVFFTKESRWEMRRKIQDDAENKITEL
jgi:hypothetical protein